MTSLKVSAAPDEGLRCFRQQPGLTRNLCLKATSLFLLGASLDLFFVSLETKSCR